MVQMRTYLNLRAQKVGTSYTWASVDYTNLLFKDGDTIATDVGVSSYIREDVPRDGVEREEINQLFLFPFPLDYVSVIDGTVSGNIAVSCHADSNYSYYKIEVRGISVDLVKIDSLGTETSLIGGDHEVTSGGPSASLDTTSTGGYLFWINVSDAKLESADRLGLRVKVNAWANTSTTDPTWVQIDLGKNEDDCMLKIPFAM
ncbi:MAG: hypothetical protein ACXQTE_03865 [Methanosarcinaceae archaeon]